MTGLKRLAKRVAFLLAGIIALFLLIVLFFKIGRWYDFSQQESRMAKLADVPVQKHNEQDFVDFPLNSNIRYNQIQVVATHNSYHSRPDRLRWLMVALGDSLSEADSLLYEHRTLYDQLSSGIRSFELDVRRRNERFEITHVPLVDDRTTSPDFELTLREINAWSDTHTGHIPVTIILELKEDWTILDPSLVPYSTEVIDDLERTIIGVFGDKILTPDDVRNRSKTLEKAIITRGWPRVKDILGKVIVVLLNVEKGDKNQKQYSYYIKKNPLLKGRALFICAEPGSGIAAFIKRDEPNVKEFHSLLEKNYVIRSRIDKRLKVDKKLRETVLASGAQHLATDFPPGEPDEETGFEFYFKGKKTVRANPFFYR